ncbi:hypothetical protein BDV19DRAFT_362958 [Aspergillus venezuelensis]
MRYGRLLFVWLMLLYYADRMTRADSNKVFILSKAPMEPHRKHRGQITRRVSGASWVLVSGSARSNPTLPE